MPSLVHPFCHSESATDPGGGAWRHSRIVGHNGFSFDTYRYATSLSTSLSSLSLMQCKDPVISGACLAGRLCTSLGARPGTAPANRSEMALASWLGAVFVDCQPMLTTSVDELLQRLFHEGAIFAGVRSACRSASAFSFQSAGPCSLETGARAATPRMLETLTVCAATSCWMWMQGSARSSSLGRPR